ncbi:MAG: precorrin-2 dehydrogenase [bacterium]|nr:MAG: precorrin-2 dehydrogenase [bacterium]
MNYFPIAVNLSKMTVLVVGGGEVACRKILKLYPYSQKIQVIAPKTSETLNHFILKNQIPYLSKDYDINDLVGVDLCIAATDSSGVNKQISLDCHSHKIWCNSVTSPEDGQFIFPAFFRSESLTIAVSTDGKSPLLGRMIKENLEKEYSERFTSALMILGELRETYKSRIPASSRKLFWEKVIQLLLSEKRTSEGLKDEIERLSLKFLSTDL